MICIRLKCKLNVTIFDISLSPQKSIATILLVVTIIVAFTSAYPISTYAQANQGSVAWAASIAFVASGGVNVAQYGAANIGSQSVAICQKAYAYNGTAIWSGCTEGPIPVRGTSTGKSTAWFSVDQNFLGWSGSVVVYSKDGATPITPFGWVQIDQQGNKVINGAYSLTWTSTSPPSS